MTTGVSTAKSTNDASTLSQPLPPGLSLDAIERMGLPVVAACSNGDVRLNHRARSIWSPSVPRSIVLPVTIDGAPHSLASLLTSNECQVDGTPSMSVQLPDGEHYEVEILPCSESNAADRWRVAVLHPVRHEVADRALFGDKVKRLKAIVHEFRNTLTAAKEALAFLDEGVLGDLNTEQRRFLSSATEDLESLVRALVELTSLWMTRAGVFRMVAKPVDVDHVVRQTTTGARPIAEQRDVALEIERCERDLSLIGDHELLVRALRNVVTNAIRHTPPGGVVCVRTDVVTIDDRRSHSSEDTCSISSADVSDETIVIEVRDSGAGIDPADQARIFQPLERGHDNDSTVDPAGGGMGLGLTIARDIAVTHGGSLELTSTPGKGSCFAFCFPRSKADATSWMTRAIQRAIEDIRPLGAPLAGVLLRFEDNTGETSRTESINLLSAVQQIAIKNLRSIDTVLAIEDKLLLLIRGSTRAAAFAMIDRVLRSLAELLRVGDRSTVDCCMMFGVAVYPEDGSDAASLLALAEQELNEFPTR